MEDLSNCASTYNERIRSGSLSDSESSMTIFVVDPAQNHLLFGVANEDTVFQLKNKIADRRGIPQAQQKLMFGGQQLQDDAKLGDYNIRAQSCIHLDVWKTQKNYRSEVIIGWKREDSNGGEEVNWYWTLIDL